MIELQFSTSTETVSHIIASICHSHFSHVDIVLPHTDGNLLGSSDSPKAPVIQGNPGGVAIRPKNYQRFGYRRIAQIRTPSEDFDQRFYKRALSQLGEPFDNQALHAFINGNPATDRDWRDASAWFCSEYIAWDFEEEGFFQWPLIVGKNMISPPDLLLILNFAIINAETFYSEVPPEFAYDGKVLT